MVYFPFRQPVLRAGGSAGETAEPSPNKSDAKIASCQFVSVAAGFPIEKIIVFSHRMENKTDRADDLRYMQEALKEAHRALEREEVPVGAVVVCGGRIIARAHNLTEALNDPTAHAEMQAITMAAGYLGGKYLNDCTLYVTVEPCPMCAGALNWAQTGRIVYGADDPRRGYSLFGPSLLHPRTEVTAGVLKEECGRLMVEFFKNRR